jgi:two-component system alkaline phosphatase synthesis response regulator PhoP
MKKVLVIDDELSVRKLVAFILRKKGFEVITANDGQEGLNLAYEKKPDLIILDLRLPVMDGVEVGKQLKESEQLCHIPVVLITASVDNIDEKARECMADGYFLKPFDYQELVRKVEQLLA